ncbi:MFS transporter [Paenibacillus amylolyticus]|uniref:MFS transporter n=1 Tax=Paenibacillus amylolyticus TaxID=1451 RepID=A0A5M9WMZ4_PAEAM|nr:MFS transporter [Paenibacillus amylolyticus]KAA8782947.1 MFS transporter [Paenibacillus amylolyticus]
MLKRSYYYLLATVTLSSFGDVFGLLAMEWIVYELTASKLAMGAMALCFSISEVLFRLLGSPLSDRLNRGKFMSGLVVIRLAALLIPLTMSIAGHLHIWHLFIAAALSGACSALFMPTAMAVIPGVVDKHQLIRSFAVIDGARNASALIGPALAGALIALAGSLPTLGVNAACYLLALTALLYMPTIHQQAVSNVTFSFKKYIQDIGEACSFYRKFPAMLTIMVMVSISNMSSIAVWTMMIPFVREVLHKNAATMGTLTSASAFGTLGGLLIISKLGEFKKRRVVMLCSLATIGLSYVLLGAFPSYPFALLILCIAGAAGPFFGVLSSSLHGTLVPVSLQGRVNSIRFLIGGGLQPVGAFAGAAIAERFGIPTLLLTIGLLPIFCSIAASFLPNLKFLDGDLSKLKKEESFS